MIEPIASRRKDETAVKPIKNSTIIAVACKNNKFSSNLPNFIKCYRFTLTV